MRERLEKGGEREKERERYSGGGGNGVAREGGREEGREGEDRERVSSTDIKDGIDTRAASYLVENLQQDNRDGIDTRAASAGSPSSRLLSL